MFWRQLRFFQNGSTELGWKPTSESINKVFAQGKGVSIDAGQCVVVTGLFTFATLAFLYILQKFVFHSSLDEELRFQVEFFYSSFFVPTTMVPKTV